jgi:hypothetical protein
MLMTFLRRLLVSSTLFVLVSLVPHEIQAKPRPKKDVPLGTLAGTVLVNKAPVAQSTVHVWRDGKNAGLIPVDAKGEFHFSFPDGTYEVEAAAPHYRPAITARVTVVVHAQHETWVNLELVPAP